MSIYDVYYKQQVGGGVDSVFVGAPRMRGHGLGSWFSGIFRSALPILAKGARAVGKEALKAGVNMLDDVAENNMSFRDSFHNRVNESGMSLKRKAAEKIHKMMEGSGYSALARKRRAQSRSRSATRRKPKRRVKRRTKSVKRLKKKIKKKKTKAKKKTTKKNKKKTKRTRKSKKTHVQDIFG